METKISKEDLEFYTKELSLRIELFQHLYDIIKKQKENIKYFNLENIIEKDKKTKKIDSYALKLLNLDRIGNDYLGVLGQLSEMETYSYDSFSKEEKNRIMLNKEKKELLKDIKESLNNYKKLTVKQFIKEYY